MKSLMTVRLWAPWTQRLVARHWKRAISGWALTASSVANRTSVSTPFSVLRMVVLMAPPGVGAARRMRAAAGEAQRAAGNVRFIRGKRAPAGAGAAGSVARVEGPLERRQGAGEEQAHRVGGVVRRGLRLERPQPRGRHDHGLLDDLPAVDAGQR